MTYRLIFLAPGSYDVALDGVIIASLLGSSERHPTWTVELRVDLPPEERPVPFTEAKHTFPSFEAAYTPTEHWCVNALNRAEAQAPSPAGAQPLAGSCQ